MKDNDTYMEALLVKHLVGETTAAEAQEVESWLAADESNRAYFKKLQTLWQQSKTMAAPETTDADVEAAWQVFQNRIGQARRVPILFSMNWLRVAAAVLLVIGIGMIVYLNRNKKPVPMLTAQSTASVQTDTLSDGSIITLNRNSILRYPQKFEGDNRAVTLQGEAFFNITPDKKKPFIIEAGAVRIQVVGTSFNVRTESEATEVIVHTGIVQVTKGTTSTLVTPNEKVTVQLQDTTWVIEKVQDELYRYYQDNQFVCDNTPLWKLVAVLNKAYNAHIIIEKPELRNLRLTTTFSNEPLDHILQIISSTFNIHVEKQDTVIVLK